MRVLVCGGRYYTDREELYHELGLLAEQHGWLTIIEGGALGADSLAGSAGPIRNKRMLDSCKPDLVVAFKGNEGTRHMIKISKEAGVEVKIIGDWL